jgi:hypothetical protein
LGRCGLEVAASLRGVLPSVAKTGRGYQAI